VEIGCNDFQGADLSRRLLHGSVVNGTQDRPVLIGTTSEGSQPVPPDFNSHHSASELPFRGVSLSSHRSILYAATRSTGSVLFTRLHEWNCFPC
jgi:hypothetical protein